MARTIRRCYCRHFLPFYYLISVHKLDRNLKHFSDDVSDITVSLQLKLISFYLFPFLIHKLFSRFNSSIVRTSQSNQTDARVRLTARVIAQSDGYVGNKIGGQTASRQQWILLAAHDNIDYTRKRHASERADIYALFSVSVESVWLILYCVAKIFYLAINAPREIHYITLTKDREINICNLLLEIFSCTVYSMSFSVRLFENS